MSNLGKATSLSSSLNNLSVAGTGAGASKFTSTSNLAADTIGVSNPDLARLPEGALEREVAAYNEHINNVLNTGHAGSVKPELKAYLPLPEMGKEALDLFERVRDGVLLAHFVAAVRPLKISLSKLVLNIDMAQLGQLNSKALFEVNSNLDLAIQAAKDAGIVVVNIGAEDILKSNKDLVLGLVWQLVRAHLLTSVNLAAHPELIRLLEKGETLPELMSLPSDQILLRWVNYHLKRAHQPTIKNLSKDITNSEAYTYLMRQIAPKLVDTKAIDRVLAIPASDTENRAKNMLEIADALGCRAFVTPKDVAAGHARLNFAFTANLFNKHIGIHLPTEEEIAAILDELDNLRARVVQLEKEKKISEVTIAELRETVRLLEEKSMLADREKESLKGEVRALRETLAAETSRYEEALRDTKSSHSAFRDAQTKELTDVKGMLEQALKGKFGDAPDGDLTSQLRWFVAKLIEENARQAKQIEELLVLKDRNDKMNEVMTTKIREVSEELIEYKKKQDKKK